MQDNSKESKSARCAYIAWSKRLNDREVVYASGPCEAARRWVAHEIELDELVDERSRRYIVFVVRADGTREPARVQVDVELSDMLMHQAKPNVTAGS